MFTLRQLEALIALADSGSISAASLRLDISQAAASSLLAGLERETGLSLLHNRRGARAALTSEALQLLQPARDIVQQAHLLMGMVGRMSHSPITELRVAARPHIIDQWLRNAVIQLERENTDLAVSILRGTNEDIIALVECGEVAAGFLMTEGEAVSLPSKRIGVLPAGLFVAPSHPLAQIGSPSPAEIASAGFILPPKNTALERRVLERLSRVGLHGVFASGRTEQKDSVRLMALAGSGIGLLFESEVKEEMASGRLVPLPMNFPPVELHVVWKAVRHHALDRLVGLVDAECRRGSTPDPAHA
ncbi:DNA-binding transcriptional LysR family regulator [Sphingobium sp. B11D3B]|uniref:LysR family transcriptional regulator n=1 Tax=Sphingobium sp. B11D3B TaxID=2940575 RepID=UPI002227E222|nr:LysR family transcriptional regulator [Sphingobium sp. B11D3B]MCW2389329.1 DNA-binding transcriptional LysR family regulator [Sphingobium sp. B11D3B]